MASSQTETTKGIRMIYRTGETPQLGDNVSHYVDGDEGIVTAIWTDGRSITVDWERGGLQDHHSDECGLLARASA
jgi:hypothetical protein